MKTTLGKCEMAFVLIVLVAFLFVFNRDIVTIWGGLPDWAVYRRAVSHWLEGGNPYYTPGRWLFYNPPWVLPLLLPFYILPAPWDAVLLMTVTQVAVAFAGYRMGGRVWGVILLLLSPPVVACMLCGQLDWLVLLGMVLPPQYGIFLVSIKPQMGIGMILYWFAEAWRTHGFLNAVKLFVPFTLFVIASFGCFGFWPLHWLTLSHWESNLPLTFWPFGIPLGIFGIYQALRHRDKQGAICAGPFLSSHVRVYSWAGCFLTLVTEPWALALMSISMWIVLLVVGVEV